MIFLIFFLIFSILPLYSDIEIGAYLRARNYSTHNTDLNSNTVDNSSYWNQRSIFYVNFLLTSNISTGFEILKDFRWGKDSDDIGFSQAYLLLKQKTPVPVELKIGKQSWNIGDGLLIGVNKDNTEYSGIDGIRGNFKLPFGIDFTAGSFEIEKSTSSIFVFQVKKFLWKNIFSVTFLKENRKSEGKRKYYSLRYETSKIKRIFWAGELIKTSGKDGYGTELNSLSYLIRAVGKGNVSRIGDAIVRFVYTGISGHPLYEPTTSKDTFKPLLSNVKEEIFGENFISKRFYYSSYTLENLKILCFGIGLVPRFIKKKKLEVFFNTYTYDLFKVKGEKNLGAELDYGIKYRYSYNLNFRFIVSKFTAGKAITPNKESSEKILFETKIEF